jgi:hypothetical protein
MIGYKWVKMEISYESDEKSVFGLLKDFNTMTLALK